MSKAMQEAKAEGQRLLDQARQAADELSARRREALLADAQNLDGDVYKRQVERRDSGGGARCTERHSTPRNGGSRSMVWPKTSSMRDSTPRPTGTCSGFPVSSTPIPRASPWVGVKAMPRT